MYLNVVSEIAEMVDKGDSSQGLYEIYMKILMEFFQGEVLVQIRARQGEELVAEIIKQWHSFTIFSTLLNRLFDYIDRHYLTIRKKDSLGQICFAMFKSQVIEELRELIQQTL